jgi:hypothetical protein
MQGNISVSHDYSCSQNGGSEQFIVQRVVRMWYYEICALDPVIQYNGIMCIARPILRTEIAQWYSAGLRAGWSGGSIPGRGWEFFSSPLCPDRFWGPPSLLSNGYQGALSLGVKRPGREADHSPPSSAEAKNAWTYTSTPPVRLWPVRARRLTVSMHTKVSNGQDPTKLQCNGLATVTNLESRHFFFFVKAKLRFCD